MKPIYKRGKSKRHFTVTTLASQIRPSVHQRQVKPSSIQHNKRSPLYLLDFSVTWPCVKSALLEFLEVILIGYG